MELQHRNCICYMLHKEIFFFSASATTKLIKKKALVMRLHIHCVKHESDSPFCSWWGKHTAGSSQRLPDESDSRVWGQTSGSWSPAEHSQHQVSITTQTFACSIKPSTPSFSQRPYICILYHSTPSFSQCPDTCLLYQSTPTFSKQPYICLLSQTVITKFPSPAMYLLTLSHTLKTPFAW